MFALTEKGSTLYSTLYFQREHRIYHIRTCWMAKWGRDLYLLLLGQNGESSLNFTCDRWSMGTPWGDVHQDSGIDVSGSQERRSTREVQNWKWRETWPWRACRRQWLGPESRVTSGSWRKVRKAEVAAEERPRKGEALKGRDAKKANQNGRQRTTKWSRWFLVYLKYSVYIKKSCQLLIQLSENLQ